MSLEPAARTHWVYLLTLVGPDGQPCRFRHAAHYIGSTRHLRRRLRHHRAGTGAVFLRRAAEAGLGFVVSRVWRFRDGAEARAFERRVKRWPKRDCCPHCNKRLSRYAIRRQPV